MASGLATRCSACGTVFRVVPDQLRVSEGWVRCGRCAEVFNASESLLDLDSGAPLPARDEPPPPRAMLQFGARRAPADGGPDTHDGPQAQPARRPAGAAAPAPPTGQGMPVVDDAESRFAPDAADTAYPPTAAAAAEPPRDFSAEPRLSTAPTPLFLRQAERAARWRQPRVRAALLAGAALGVAGLALQVVFEYRDLTAARFPALRPVLEAACLPLGCSVGPARIIEGLVVESSGLLRVEKSEVYKLSVALRNRAALELALPALELSLTDSQGKLVARRVLPMSELGVTQDTLAAGRELALNATLQAATVPVAGYTIELFYP